MIAALGHGKFPFPKKIPGVSLVGANLLAKPWQIVCKIFCLTLPVDLYPQFQQALAQVEARLVTRGLVD